MARYEIREAVNAVCSREDFFFFCKDDLKWLQKLDIDTLDYSYQMEALALIRAQAAGILNSSQARNQRCAFPCCSYARKRLLKHHHQPEFSP